MIPVDILLRGSEVATTAEVEGVTRPPREWTDDDVRLMLEGMLKAMHRLKHPEDDERPVALRGVSWIVNPYDEGGVVVAIEITLGAAVAGPFDIEQAALEKMIARVMARPSSPTVH